MERNRTANRCQAKRSLRSRGFKPTTDIGAAEFALWAHCRNHVQQKATPRNFHDRRLSQRSPSRACVIVRADARFVREINPDPFGFSFGTNRWIDFRFPRSYQDRLLLLCSVERLLGGEAQQLHNPANRRKRQFLTEFAFDQSSNQRKRHQTKDKLELQRSIVLYHSRQPAKTLRTLTLSAVAMAFTSYLSRTALTACCRIAGSSLRPCLRPSAGRLHLIAIPDPKYGNDFLKSW